MSCNNYNSDIKVGCNIVLFFVLLINCMHVVLLNKKQGSGIFRNSLKTYHLEVSH